MKIRKGFVSNSSSSSFIVKKENLTEEQMEVLLSLDNTSDEVKKVFTDRMYNDYNRNLEYHKIADEIEWDEWWYIYEMDECINGDTMMSNDCLELFMSKIGINLDKVEWGSY